jgi:hypothetical protein
MNDWGMQVFLFECGNCSKDECKNRSYELLSTYMCLSFCVDV